MEKSVSPHLLSRPTAGRYVVGVSQTAAAIAAKVREVRRPYSGASPAELQELVDEIDLDRPLETPAAVLEEVARLYLDHAVWFHEPGYVAHLNCPVALPAINAEVILAAVNSSVDTFDQSATGTLIERRLIDWTAGRIGFGPGADGVFTSGGTQSNLQALLLARQARGGVRALERLRVFATAASHFSIAKSASLLGLPDSAVVEVPTDARGRMDAVALDRAIVAAELAGGLPMAVVATAGTTDLGVIDPLRELGRVASAHGVWFHVDAAYGCGLLVSARRRGLLDGIERADSVTVDFHKSFFQPVSSSALVVRHGETLRSIAVHADYLNPKAAELPNQVDKSLQTTRRLDALKLWMTLRTLGADQLGELFDRVVDLAREVHGSLVEDPDFEVAQEPTLSTVLLRYRPSGMSEANADFLVPEIHARLFAGGEAIVAKTRYAGRAWLKFTLLNPNTTLADVEVVIGHVRAAARELVPQPELVP